MSYHALVIGEALIDRVVQKDNSTADHPGGSPANVALGLARLGRDVELLAAFGKDAEGAVVADHLTSNGVKLVPGSDHLDRTSVATATLDDEGAASYVFDLDWSLASAPEYRDKPVVAHTGSIAAVLQPGGAQVAAILDAVRDHATITYDPNARPALMGDPAEAREIIESFIKRSDVVKVSDEDIAWLAPNERMIDVAKHWATLGPAFVVVTRGGSGANAFLSDGRRVDIVAPRVDVADTVGAGDSFMGGLIDGLWSADLLGADGREHLHSIGTETLSAILERCARIAAITVSRPGANPPRLSELS